MDMMMKGLFNFIKLTNLFLFNFRKIPNFNFINEENT